MICRKRRICRSCDLRERTSGYSSWKPARPEASIRLNLIGTDRKGLCKNTQSFSLRFPSFAPFDPCNGLRRNTRKVVPREMFLNPQPTQGGTKSLVLLAPFRIGSSPIVGVNFVENGFSRGFVFAKTNRVSVIRDTEAARVWCCVSRRLKERKGHNHRFEVATSQCQGIRCRIVQAADKQIPRLLYGCEEDFLELLDWELLERAYLSDHTAEDRVKSRQALYTRWL